MEKFLAEKEPGDVEIDDPQLLADSELVSKHRPLTVLMTLKDRLKQIHIEDNLQEFRNPHTSMPVFTYQFRLRGSKVEASYTDSKKKSCRTLAAQAFLKTLFGPIKWLQLVRLLEQQNKKLLEKLVLEKLD